MTDKEKQHSGVLYQPLDPQIMEEQLALLDTLR